MELFKYHANSIFKSSYLYDVAPNTHIEICLNHVAFYTIYFVAVLPYVKDNRSDFFIVFLERIHSKNNLFS